MLSRGHHFGVGYYVAKLPLGRSKLSSTNVGVGFDGGAAERAPVVDLKVLHAKIGELTLENDFLAGALGKAGLLSAKR
jgi:transposase